jgi:hypothetical protein
VAQMLVILQLPCHLFSLLLGDLLLKFSLVVSNGNDMEGYGYIPSEPACPKKIK